MATYRYNDDGTLEYASVVNVCGDLYTHFGQPLAPTGETVKLKGWPDRQGQIYETQGGIRYVIGAMDDEQGGRNGD